MHDDAPQSRRDRRSDDPNESAFDALGLSDFLDPTQENPVVDPAEPNPVAAPAHQDAAAPEPTDAPAPESTDVATQAATDAPVQAPTDAPVQAPTDAATQAPTDALATESARERIEPESPREHTEPASARAARPPLRARDLAAAEQAAQESGHATPSAAASGWSSFEDVPPVFASAPTGFTAPAPTTAVPNEAEAEQVAPAPLTPRAGTDSPTVAVPWAIGETFGSGHTDSTGQTDSTTDTPGADLPTAVVATGASAAPAAGLAAGGAGGAGRGGSGRSGWGRGGSGGGSGRGGSGRGGSAGGGSGGGPLAGILTWIRNNPRASLIAGIAAAVVVLGGLSLGVGAATAPARAAGASVPLAASPTPSASAKPTVRPTPSAAAAASKIRTCSVASYASARGFGTLEAQVMNATTGEVLFDRNGSNPAPTASVLKMLTAAAAFSVLGPDYRVPTTVVKGSQPGQVVVIGGGDVTLSRLPSGQQSFYTNAPHIDDLANQVKQAWASDPANAGQPITSLVVDTSLYSGPVWLPSWDEHEERVVEGSTPYMTSFMVDGDRNDPTAVESPRSTDPVGRAASVLADDLGNGVAITGGTAPAGAKQLGQVLSQPVSALAEEALTYSDNTIMEELARLVAIKTGAGNSFSAINAGVLKGLQTYGISENGLYFADGSGLSADNKVPASYLTQFMVKVLNRQGSLGSIYDGLPVAGKTGTLGPGYGRFDGSFSSNAVGHVNAKTGWINTSRTLAGVIHGKDGTNLTFAIYALNYGSDDAALSAIDDLTTAFYECGNNLSNN